MFVGEVIHNANTPNFDDYYYFKVCFDVDAVAEINGENGIGPFTGPICIDMSVTSIVVDVGNIYLVGKKKPETTFGYNSDGTLNIKG